MTTITDQAAKDREAFLSGEYTPEQYGEWLKELYHIYFVEKKAPFDLGYPVHTFIGIRGDIGREVQDIYDGLPDNAKERFKSGLGFAVDTTTEIEPLKYLLFLAVSFGSRYIRSPKVLDFAVKYLRQENQKDLQICAVCLMVLQNFIKETSARSTLIHLLGDADFINYTPLILYLLIYGNPDGLIEYLGLADAHILAMYEQSSNEREYEWLMGKRIAKIVGIERIRAVFPEIESRYTWLKDALLHEKGPCEIVAGELILRKKKKV
ncbi:MAG: hypothetical protein HGB03_00025 [Candidatus Yonathbacteria bacterium]|nr:hypothetical protein [Candidatus Yonathbacteria bacterium]NTW48067.1 hypothetical protein [Candidatus Yonathbacteria bacterium]